MNTRRIPLPPALRTTAARSNGGANPEALFGSRLLDLVQRKLATLACALADQVTARNYRKIRHTWHGAIKLATLLCGPDKSLWLIRNNNSIRRLYNRLRNQ